MARKDRKPHTVAELKPAFAFIKESRFEGVNGVWHVDSGRPGPVLGVTICTHGNEPSGLAALWHFRSQLELQKKLLKGSVFFVLNNVKAAEKYFATLAMKNSKARDRAKRHARFCNLNLNRLPTNTMKLKRDRRYEILRAQELRFIWSRFDVGLDIHSTEQDSPPMIMTCGGLHRDLIAGFPFGIIVNNIDVIQIGKPTVSFYGAPDRTRVVGIETGSHENASSFGRAVRCARALMRNLGMLKSVSKTASRERKEYFIEGSITFPPKKGYKLVKVFKPFGRIRKGELVACGRGKDIRAPFTGHALFGPKTRKPSSEAEEVLFLSRPVRTVKV